MNHEFRNVCGDHRIGLSYKIPLTAYCVIKQDILESPTGKDKPQTLQLLGLWTTIYSNELYS